MTATGFALFETAIGACGIAWGPGGIAGLQLPETTPARALARLRRRFPGALPGDPPPAVAEAMARIAAFLAGGGPDVTDIPLDLTGASPFERAVYGEARRIPAGSTATYGAVAAAIGAAGEARAVGQALGRNPWPIAVPCHRVTGADGRMGGFSAPGGRATKLKLLEMEGALAAESLPLFRTPAA